MNQYEAMFIFDPTFGAKFENVQREISRIMERASATDVVTRKWDERRLAYKIQGRKRGLYVLVYFKAPGDNVAGIEHDAKLSENILRVLVVRADHVTPEVVERVNAELDRMVHREEFEPGGDEPRPPRRRVAAGAGMSDNEVVNFDALSE